ncbi:MAG: IMP dehydrogenase [Flavobacteriaceae bacterium]|nr:IMP dehydrogenase [Flavobacteriaceae bacterium]
MSKSKFVGEGLTYDDVLLVPAYSDVLPSEVSLKTKFSRNINLNIPIVSAAMDTVTESKMAIAIASEGGIGVIHKNLSIEDQSNEVRLVKRAESGMIIDPVTLPKDSLVIDAKNNMKKYKIGGIPIVSNNGKLIGIVTNRDLRFEKDNSKKISDVMTSKNLITTKIGTSLAQAEEILQSHKIEKLPVVDSKGVLVGLITFRDINKHSEKPISNKDKLGRLMVSAAIGTDSDYLKRTKRLVESGVDAIVIDTAHAHSSRVGDVLKSLKDSYSDIDIIVGNIASADAAEYLKDNGADAIKVGIGPGSICTTRVVAGVGYPQLSAIINISEVLKNSSIPLIADGGIKFTGDITKAIAAGADSVMLGSLLAGTEESPGETVIYDGRKFKTYRGMGSVEAMQKGSKDRYFQSDQSDDSKLVPEGIVGRVPYKGQLNESINQFVGGLRSGMGYCGSKDIGSLKNSSKFVKITGSGIRESHPHNVSITKEAPNYSPPKL